MYIKSFSLILSLFFIALVQQFLGHDAHAQVNRNERSSVTIKPSKLPPAALKELRGKGVMKIESTEGFRDTITFHVGSPLFLKIKGELDPRICKPFNGQFFYFDPAGAQLGWGFEEVTDSVLFPGTVKDCNRYLMLSSENSNRLAEGYYAMKAQLFIDAKNKISSNTIVLHPIHSTQGADNLSYLRFLQEQLLKNANLLRDPETLKALFEAKDLVSAESQIYRAVALYKLGDVSGVNDALNYGDSLASRGSTVSAQALAVKKEVLSRIKQTPVN